MMSNPLSHVDENGTATMVDVSAKQTTLRLAAAEAVLKTTQQVTELIAEGGLPKGDALAVARIAGIMAAKRTSELIPLCHQLPLSKVAVDFEILPGRVQIRTEAKTTAGTGVEMEALTAASVAALTLYDMIKAVDKSATISDIRLFSKSGGASGDYQLPDDRTEAAQ
ncbi:cyclic pyranopterin monophosphate synthase MoaC [Acaricomes phytoseiuli]|uniref:cyclic pyranopterin monophosphate synthase MoaC n=1 Tax=Acaricomes phytoseiuli TaxID=291968 RepID=UPI0003A79B83|nr:cyclic pyranopterin monophosphate synthase MoaC [Acaricomes phytoseiuli]MCW1248796.1 cyclic pyranopterin monophosphate synthase MoaC [Acaricomes phytoseiuli]